MHCLVSNSGTDSWEIQLKPGSNSFGRSEDNDFQLTDSSISSHHCEVTLGAGDVRVKDLGSTNGTFINNIPIDEACLQPGQTLRLGKVPLVFQCTAPSSTGSDKPVFCRNHYQNLARFFCPRCKRHFCDLCVNTRGSAAGGLKFCKVCATECQPVAIKPIERQVEFFAEARQAFQYPFRGDGWILLLGGSFFFGFLDLANYVGRNSFAYAMRAMMMRVVIFTFILGSGYLFSYLKKIIAYTAQGEPHMPDWPELTEWKEDIVAPMFQFLMICCFSFGPAFLTWLVMDFWFEVDYPWLVWLVSLAGCAYFPMALLGVAMFDSLAAAHPLFVIGSITVVPREYSIAVLVFAGILAFRWLSETLLAMLLRIPLVPILISDLLGICLLMVEARILGLLYLSKKQTLGWFKNAR